MCTAITFTNKDFFFGRTLDLEYTYGEEIVVTPRNYSILLREKPHMDKHYAIIGMAHVADNFPLYYDAVNEKGLCMAGLNFPGFAQYRASTDGKDNIATFELIPWILGQCANMEEVRDLLPTLQLTGTPFSPELSTTPLHWIIADQKECITVESVTEGIKIYENPVGVMTNNPPFNEQMLQLRNFMHLSPYPPHNHFSPDIDLKPYSRGMGAIGLPGDLSSQSRFVRAAFTKLNSICPDSESVSQFFHIMDTVNQAKGCCRLDDGNHVVTQYTSCCNASKGIYHYTTYGNRRICAVDMHKTDLDNDQLISYPLLIGEDIQLQN